MSGLPVSKLFVTQNDLREKKQLLQMIKYVKTDGVFDHSALGSYAIRHNIERVAPLIEIARFEDGILAIHNGHHRVSSILIGRKSAELHTSEFFIRDWKYSDYLDIVLPTWVTPFNILTELRVSELSEWKAKVREFYVLHGEQKTKQFILENKSEYALPRDGLYTVEDFANRLGL